MIDKIYDIYIRESIYSLHHNSKEWKMI